MTQLQNAYETISDPTKRRAYDIRWPSIRDSLRAQQESEKRQNEAAEAEKKRAAEVRVKKQKEDNAREERLRVLEQSRWRYDGEIFELSRVIRKLAADLTRLKEQDDEDVRKEKERNGWWALFTSPIYGRVKETDEQKQERDLNRNNRIASKRIKGSELAEKTARLQKLQDALQDVNAKIAAEKKQREDEKRREENEAMARKMKMAQEARDREIREQRELMAKKRREAMERAAKEAEAREARMAQERARAAAEAAERRRREAEEEAEIRQRAQEVLAAMKARRTRNHSSGPSTRGKSTCRHEGWWPKREGRQLCGTCHTFQSRFVLQCPGCKIVACASCQKTLRGGRWKNTGRPYEFAGGSHFVDPDDSYQDDIPYHYDYDYD